QPFTHISIPCTSKPHGSPPYSGKHTFHDPLPQITFTCFTSMTSTYLTVKPLSQRTTTSASDKSPTTPPFSSCVILTSGVPYERPGAES
ncbi:uncharacterized protein EI90DRAFT_3052460, partial [Cantharellus anzutake]|uniref:uncharacterized protein n=1 Tax=Cantharellus anzutake TaxID=1750568 RepID=UPI001905C359